MDTSLHSGFATDTIVPVSAITDPAVRALMEHIEAMRSKNFTRFCALLDLLDLVLNENALMRDREIAMRLLNLDLSGQVDAMRSAYMEEHNGKDGTEDEEQAKEQAKAEATSVRGLQAEATSDTEVASTQ